MKQYKTCNGCKADGAAVRDGCSLRYPRKDGRRIAGVTVEAVPAVPCPKPKTNADFCTLLRAGAYFVKATP